MNKAVKTKAEKGRNSAPDSESANYTMTARQLGVLLLISIFGMRLLLLPGILMQEAGNGAYLSFLAAAVVTFFMILVAVYIMRHSGGKTFTQILEGCFGKIITKFILAAVLAFFVYKIILTDYEVESFVFETLYENVSWAFFIVPLFITMGYVAYKGPRVMGRIGEIIFIFAFAAVVICMVLAVPNMQLSNALPIADKGLRGIWHGAVSGFSFGGEFLFLLILNDNISEKEEAKIKKRLVTTAAIGLAVITLFMFVFVCIFGSTGILIKDGLTKVVQFSPTYNAPVRLDGIVTLVFTPIIILYTAISIYCAVWCFKNLFGIRSFIVPTSLITLAVLAIKLIPTITPEKFLQSTTFIFAILSAALQIVLPLVLAVVIFLKNNIRRRKYEFNKIKTKQK